MLTDRQIDVAKRQCKTESKEPNFEHNDCIRMAYEWLDAQKKIGSYTKKTRALKHIIERWAGRYVSQSDVEVAAFMHPEINGGYPHFNISAHLVNPNIARLKKIGEAFKHSNSKTNDPSIYSTTELD